MPAVIKNTAVMEEPVFNCSGVGIFPIISEPYARLDLVYVLTAGATAAECVPFYLTLIYLNFKGIGFRQDGNRSGGCMDPTLSFGYRDALDPVNTGFVFQCSVYFLTCHGENYLLISS